MTEIEFLREVEKSHLALLTTLGASKSGWIRWVCQNSKGRYDHLKGIYEPKQREGSKVRVEGEGPTSR